MRKSFLLICLLLGSISLSAQSVYAPTEANRTARQWFTDARFGLFVHFGPYAVLGSGEWVMNTRPIDRTNYLRLQEFFNPQAFDAAQWVSMVKATGMKYITFTSRHHDGFSNWDTKQSDWKITNTPYKKDLLRQLADECRKQDIKLFLYYSLLDWTRDDYQWRTGRTGQRSGRTAPSDWASYINFMKAQLTELLTEYGPIGGIWFDGHWDQTADENRTDHQAALDWHYDEIYALIHRLQPSCLVANNHHLPPFAGEDFQIFERDLPGENKEGYSGQAVSENLPLESCATMNNSWGYSITDSKYKSTKELVEFLVRAAGYGGNLLLNVGPMPNGAIQTEFVEHLAQMGEWTKQYGETIYGTQGGFIRPQTWGAVTQKGSTCYIHILQKPDDGRLSLNLPATVKSVRWFDSTQRVTWDYSKKTGTTTFVLDRSMNPFDTVLVVETK